MGKLTEMLSLKGKLTRLLPCTQTFPRVKNEARIVSINIT